MASLSRVVTAATKLMYVSLESTSNIFHTVLQFSLNLIFGIANFKILSIKSSVSNWVTSFNEWCN